MVQDPRVSRQLARLGGVYRDPARVNRDASSLLKSSVGQHLTPIAANYTDDSGNTKTVLVLQGTIAIHFRGNTYQLLMDVYLIPLYPMRPPVCYVRLANNMYLKENHRHCGSDGKVYLPYLHEWKPHSHNLVEMVVAMSSVFSADPPVFSRASASGAATTTASSTASRPASAAASSYASTNNNNRNDPPPFSQSLNTQYGATTTTTTSNTSSWRDQQQQLEDMMAREAAEANAAAEAVRRAEEEEREREQAKIAYEEAQKKQAKASLTSKLQNYCRKQAQITEQMVSDDHRDKQRLEASSESIESQINALKKQKEDLQSYCETVTACTEDIQDWLEQHENSAGKVKVEKSIDDICVGMTAKDRQMLDLAAENASISDALYFLDLALYQSKLSAIQHLKQVRKLAKRQFMVRAHILKLQSLSNE